MTTMRSLFTLLFLWLVINIQAQGILAFSKPIYMEVSRVSAGSIKIDDGSGKDNKYEDEEGNIYTFKSAVGAVNFFMGRGWKMNTFTQSSGEDNRILRIYLIEKLQEETLPDSVTVYMEISRVSAGDIKVDMGLGKDEGYIDENGKIYHFESTVGAVNFFISEGWKLNKFTQSSGEDNRILRIYLIEKKTSRKDADKFFEMGINKKKTIK